MPEELSALEPDELQRRVTEVRERMKPVEKELAALRAERDVLLTEVRRRERQAHRVSRADVKTAMKEGRFPAIAELVAAVVVEKVAEFLGVEPSEVDPEYHDWENGPDAD